MKELKDLFSTQAGAYAAFRPVYPPELYDFLFSITSSFDAALDCGTGNGQVASRLAERFVKVEATDISVQQLLHAIKKENIHYQVARAEHTPFPGRSFDLITVGTALHWFDFDSFYKEVKRVARPAAHLAVWAYAPFRCTPAIDAIVDDFFFNVVGPYWDAERKYVDEQYKTIPFPFEEVDAPPLEIKATWQREQFVGYLNSWSAVQHYIRQNGINPVSLIEAIIEREWPEGVAKELSFPLFLRVGKL
jgi:SAM-dependent methyltransferase